MQEGGGEIGSLHSIIVVVEKGRRREMLKKLGQQDMTQFLRNLLLIEDEKIEEDMKEHSYKFAELGVLLAKARAEYEQRKLEFQILEANLGKEFRETLPKVTERAVEEAIVRTPEWQEARRKVIEAKQEVDILTAIVEALSYKKDLLISYLSWRKEAAKLNSEF